MQSLIQRLDRRLANSASAVNNPFNAVALASLMVASACLPMVAEAQSPASIGEVEQSRGVGFVQTPGQTPRSLSAGTSLREGDRLTTAAQSVAIVRLADGTKMTVRPSSEMVLSQFKYQAGSSENSFVLDLFRGGLRAITGLINKNSPNAAKIQTSTATIGIRGTDFDARSCQAGECASGAAASTAPGLNAQIAASAKLLRTKGAMQVLDAKGQRRTVVEGSSVFPGETVETGADAQAVLAFRDESKVALGASSRFRVDNFVFDNKAPAEGSFVTTLLRGSLRAVTGLIGKANQKNVRYSTSTATIGIRGTEFVLLCISHCAGESFPQGAGFMIFTIEGATTATTNADNQLRDVLAGLGLSISPTDVITLNQLPTGQNFPDSPSSLPIPDAFFTQRNSAEGQDGLYVYVRDGHIEMSRDGQVLHLGPGETGLSGSDPNLIRPINTPIIILRDPIPLPSARNLQLLSLLPPNTGNLPQCPRP